MTSKLTREENVQAVFDLKASYTLGLADVEILKRVARMALAAMGGEPHTDDELSNLLWYSQEATCHSDPNYYCEFQRLATPGLIAGIIRELQERRKAAMDSEPVAIVEPSDYVTAAQLVGEGPARKAVHELYEGALRIGDKLYRHAQPAPVVPDNSDPRDAFEVVFPMPKHAQRCGAGYCATAYSAWDAHDFIQRWKGWSVCRDAMLNGGKS